jgi:glutamyl-Q tRNA(Asp) synthetase
VLVNAQGQKLSKQTGASAVAEERPNVVATTVLGYLGLAPPPALIGAPPAELWGWAAANWNPTRFAGRHEIDIDASGVTAG